LVMV